VVAGRVEGMIGVHAVGGDCDGRMLDGSALAQMAEQVAREALRL